MNLKEAAGYLLQLRDLHRVRRAQPPLRQSYRALSIAELTAAR
jgi:hypothetical protein